MDPHRHNPPIIQALDNIENNCSGVFFEKSFIFNNFHNLLQEENLLWKHSNIIDDSKCTYLSLFLKNESLENYSSNPHKFKSYEGLIRSQKKAAIAAKVDFSEMCFFDVVPEHLMQKWFELREDAMANIFFKIDKPSDYEILHKIHVLVECISKQCIQVGHSQEKILYDMFSSATGRLATKRESFPVMSLNKELRYTIKPRNNMFLEIDLNGAEIRTLLSLCGKSQPDYDIHEFNRSMAAQDLTTRQQVKARFFAWLYNPEAKDYNLEKLYNKNIYKKYYKNGYIETPFGRKLQVDERKALNYLTQSTTSDIVLQNAYKIMKFLKDKKSFIAFTMHDSIVLDFCKEEHSLVKQIKDIFETNMFGKFLSTVSIGKNYGNLKEIEI